MNETNIKTEAPHAKDFLGGNFIRKEDIQQPVTVTITDVWSEMVLNGGRRKLVVAFAELQRPLILNKTNIKRMARIFGTGDTAAWRGPVTLYVESGVEFAGRVVGGIRVRPADGQPRQVNGQAANRGTRPQPQAQTAQKQDLQDIPF